MTQKLFSSFFATVCIVLGAISPAFSQSMNLASRTGDKTIPVEVTADNGIEWMQEQQVFVARGNAMAVRDGVTVRGDELWAFYREKADGENEVYRLEARGAISIKTATETVTGQKAQYTIDNEALIVTGSPARLVTPTDEVIAHQSLEYWQREGRAVARGRATAIREDRRIEGDLLEAFFTTGADDKTDLTRAFAKGSVVLTTAQDVVTGDEGTYTTQTGLAVLTGNVRLTRGKNQLNGGYAEVNMKTGVSRLYPVAPGGAKGRVRGVFLPEKGGRTDGR